MKPLSLKYIAGLIDGEGTVDFTKNTRYDGSVLNIQIRLRITLTEKSAFVLESLQIMFGGYLEFRDKAKIYKDHQNWQPAVTWSVVGPRAAGVLQEVKQYLLIKKNQAEFALRYFLFKSDKQIKGKHIEAEERDKVTKFRQTVYNELKAMKLDPHRLSEPTLIWKQINDAIVEAPEMV